MTPAEHKSSPIAQAYTQVRPPLPPDAHPGEGTRIHRPTRPQAGPAAPLGSPPRPAAVRPASADPADGPVIGVDGASQPLARHVNPPQQPPERPSAPRRYQPAGDGAPGRAPLPRIYGGHPLLSYWYVPVAAAVAVVVALGVIWVGDKAFGGDDAPAATAVIGTPSAAASSPTSLAGTPAGAAGTVPAASTGTPSAVAGRFRVADVAVVTGAGDCLNVRTAAGTSNPAIVCLPDGSEVTVQGGPEQANGLSWWKVQTALGEGWAAEDYLLKKP